MRNSKLRYYSSGITKAHLENWRNIDHYNYY